MELTYTKKIAESGFERRIKALIERLSPQNKEIHYRGRDGYTTYLYIAGNYGVCCKKIDGNGNTFIKVFCLLPLEEQAREETRVQKAIENGTIRV